MERFEKFYAGKQVLVTGGAGFIGSHLVEQLVNLGARVTVFDNFSSGNINNLRSVLTRINLVYADVACPYSTKQAAANKDVVFHLAALVSVPESVKNPTLCDQVNRGGTLNLLNGCSAKPGTRFVFSSSAAVYGSKEEICCEEDVPNPQSPYASTKLAGEELCKQFALKHDLSTVALRYFNVYGERQNPNGDYAAVVAKFTDSLLANKPIIIYGDGKQTRDFIPVLEVVRANLSAGMLEQARGEIFNVATGKSIDLLQLIEQLEQDLSVRCGNIVFQPTRAGDVQHSRARNEKFVKILQNNGVMERALV